MPSVHKISLLLKAGASFDDSGFFSSCFEDTASAFSADKEHDRWVLSWIFEYPPDQEAVFDALRQAADQEKIDLTPGDITHEILPDIDWVKHAYQALPAFSVGTFYIYGAHARPEAPPPGFIPLEIEAATAFGSGTHGTTGGCLEVLCQLKQKGTAPQTILDIGTGSGILAIACAKLWPNAQVTGSDIDPECIRVSTLHADLNTAPQIVWMVADGMNDPKMKSLGGCDLVIANILAGPLTDMAKDITQAVGTNGLLILSGLLEAQIDKVVSAYTAQGLTLRETLIRDEWAILTLGR
ncbi:MAG: 50S ribosomal protein L11 methyltransferase [Alphaproteobacteria bacterium]|nr:50S ribosomal protein L11 methyltransferase [Alphaproteobacteria bacterium]